MSFFNRSQDSFNNALVYESLAFVKGKMHMTRRIREAARFLQIAIVFYLATGIAGTSQALDMMEGEMYAVPVPPDTEVTVDGKLDDWDLSAREWLAISEVVAERFSGEVAVMYDEESLYICAEILTSGGPMINANKPHERPWTGHDVEFRLVTTPDAPYPLKLPSRDLDHPVVKKYHPYIRTVTLWEDTVNSNPHMIIANGPPYKGKVVDPEGAEVAFTEHQNPDRYIMEARMSWKSLGVEDGKNPFKPGDKMIAFWTVLWPQSVVQRAESLRIGPTGNFGWASFHVKNWGRIIFADKNNLPKRHMSLQEYLVEAQKGKGSSFTVDLKEPMEVTVSIYDKDDNLLREITGAEARPEGKNTFFWDGYDWRGNPMPRGEYAWKAFAHKGLGLKYMGAVGTSAKVPYETKDNTGNWGANQGHPMDVACDESGVYYLWRATEGGKIIVKTDHAGNILWRNTPNTGRYGGYGPYVAAASNGKYFFCVAGWRRSELVRFDARTGLYAPYGDKGAIELFESPGDNVPALNPASPVPETCDLEVTETEIFVPLYYDNKLVVYDVETGAKKREYGIKHPRGLCMDERGILYILSHRENNRRAGNVHCLRPGAKEIPYRRHFGLGFAGNPWDIAIDGEGNFYVSENRYHHQIWTYNKHGIHTGWIGERGGRGWGGKYNPDRMLYPTGMEVSPTGKLYLAQSSTPRVFQRYDLASRKLEKEWFGEVGYAPMTWPDAQDPLTVYSRGSIGLIRAKLDGKGGSAPTEAYWDFAKMEYPEPFHGFGEGFGPPNNFVGPHGIQFMHDNPMRPYPKNILKVEGDDLVPLGYMRLMRGGTTPRRSLALGPGIEVWRDLNHNRRVEEEELTYITELAGESLGDKEDERSFWNYGPIHMDEDCNLYMLGVHNRLYYIPARSVDPYGLITWDWDSSRILIDEIVPGKERIFYNARAGIFGVNPDDEGNLYMIFNDNLDYASKEWTTQLKYGLGHTGRVNSVKFTKFNRKGERVWITGRKATEVARPGEVYHHWAQAGLIGNGYIVAASEWTPYSIYSPDGFFVDSLLTDPNLGKDPDIYTLGGGENFSGKIAWFPQRGEAYLYTANTHGMVYRITGFDKRGEIADAIRLSGTMTLDQHVNPYPPEAQEPLGPTPLARMDDPFKSGKWGKPDRVIKDNNGRKLASLYFGHDDQYLYARYEVKDNTPLENKADREALLFKKGDAVSLYLGKAGKRNKVQAGDVRIMASRFKGEPTMVAMVPESDKLDAPFEYKSPVGHETFAYVGPVPGGELKLDESPTGYTVSMKLPKAFFADLSLKSGEKLAFEAEVLLSGFGQRGFQAMSRNHLYTSRSASQAKMVDDIPSEARLYPAYWGTLEVE